MHLLQISIRYSDKIIIGVDLNQIYLDNNLITRVAQLFNNDLKVKQFQWQINIPATIWEFNNLIACKQSHDITT